MIDYVYIINKIFYIKYIKKELIINYLPIFYNENELEIINKIGMIYVKSIGFIGTINIINIINENNENFDTLKLKFNLGTSTNLFFLEIKNISFLKKILKYRDYIDYCKLKKINYINYSKNDDLIISKNFSDFFDIENNQNNKDNDDISDEETEETEETEKTNEQELNDDINGNKMVYKIPILWIPCINLTKLLDKKRLSKKILKYHYNNCLNCENNNNNRNFQFNFDNYKNKINFINHFSILDYYNYYNDPTNINKYKIENKNENNNNESEDDLSEDNESDEYNISEDSIIDEDDTTRDKLIEKIITCYSTSINYSDTLENLKLIGIDDKMTNILYYNNINNDHIYNNTLFIIK
jgi:hypothetical protein